MPLLVFWHGIGENGNGTTELSKVPTNGPPKEIKADKWPSTRPFVVLSPQHSGGGCPTATEIDSFITWAVGAYAVNPKQVFLAGLSCGAIGSWQYLGQYKAKAVAASILVCGDPGDPTTSYSAWGKQQCGLAETAIWSFHGSKDPTVPYAGDEATMLKLLQCPAPPARAVKWTPIPDAGHAIWGPVYDSSNTYGDVYAWLLAHPKP
jgi:predicted peptidase